MSEAVYAAPGSLEEAVGLLERYGRDARPLAGGTDLLVQVRTGRARPRVLVDLKRIPDCMAVDLGPDALRVGAAVPTAALREHAELRSLFPGLLEAAELIGSEQIQGRSSLGGNLCNASPAADTVPALVALGAEAVIAGPAGARSLPVESFCTGPGRNALEPGELLVALRVPRPPERTADAYLRLIPRSEMDIAVVGAAASVCLDGSGRCTAARVALGAVAPTVRRVPAAERALVGSPVDDDALGRVEAAAREAADPIDDVRGTIRYRVRVAGVLARRAVAAAAARAAGRDRG